MQAIYRIYDTIEKRHCDRDEMFVRSDGMVCDYEGCLVENEDEEGNILLFERYIVERLHIRFRGQAYQNDIIKLSDGRLLISGENDYILEDKEFTILGHAIKDAHIIDEYEQREKDKELKRHEKHKCIECSNGYYAYNGEGDKPVCENGCNHPDGSYGYMCKIPSYCKCSQ